MDKLKVRNRLLPIKQCNTPIAALLTGKYPPIQEIYHREEAKRLKKANPKKLEIRAKALAESEIFVATCEEQADDEVNYRGVIVCSANYHVIFGHDKLKLARRRGDRTVQVLRLRGKVSKDEVLAIQFRYGMREGLLGPMERMEAIGQLHAVHGHDLKAIHRLAVQRGGKKLGFEQTKNEFYNWQIFSEFTGYELGFTNGRLDKDCYSNMKYLRGLKDVREAMDRSPQVKRHLVDTTIRASQDGKIPRFQDIVPKLLSHSDTKIAFMTKSLDEALELQKAKYPDEDRKKHPHWDLVAAKEKLRVPEVKRQLGAFIERNPSGNATLQEITEINRLIGETSVRARERLYACAFDDDPILFLEIGKKRAEQLGLKVNVAGPVTKLRQSMRVI